MFVLKTADCWFVSISYAGNYNGVVANLEHAAKFNDWNEAEQFRKDHGLYNMCQVMKIE